MPQTKPEPLPRARPSDHQRWEAPRSCEVCGVRPQQQCWLDSLGRREAGDAQVRTPQFNSPQTRVRPSLLRAMLASTTDCNCFFLLANLYTAVSTEKIAKIACQTWIRQHSYRLRTYVRTWYTVVLYLQQQSYSSLDFASCGVPPWVHSRALEIPTGTYVLVRYLQLLIPGR